MIQVYTAKKVIMLEPHNIIGEGGEAEIYRVDKNDVVKIFKPPSHPEFAGSNAFAQAQQTAARIRIEECQSKLPSFPRILSPYVVTPQLLAYDSDNQNNRKIAGYTMPLISPSYSLLDLSQRAFRKTGGISTEFVLDIFSRLHSTIETLHKQDIVIGDFNNRNVLISGQDVYLIDADSMQFGPYQCNTFTARYADPRVLESSNGCINMIRNHSIETDWYAFSVLLFECLLYVHPYAGVYKPANIADRISPDERPLKRISVLHRDVRYPSVAEPFDTLPTEVQNYFSEVLQNDLRMQFPAHLLDMLRDPSKVLVVAGRIPSTGTIASTGPASSQAQTSLSRPRSANSRVIFKTNGVLLKATYDGATLRYLYHDNKQFIRENAEVVLNGALDPSLKFSLFGSSTVVGKGPRTYCFGDDGAKRQIAAEQYRGQEPVFASNENDCFFVEHGQLFKTKPSGSKLVDEVLKEQTRIWMGSDFGFGFYSAGDYRRAFLFDSENTGRKLIDTDALHGKLLNVDCRFSSNRLWLIVKFEAFGKEFNRLTVIDENGNALASINAPDGSGLWSDFITSSCAARFPLNTGGFTEALLVATNDGIMQIEVQNRKLVDTKLYCGTRDLVHPGENMLFSPAGLYVWDSDSIRLITT